jgi:hypothetical protein
VVDGGLFEFVRDLKHRPGRDNGVLGSISVAQALLAADYRLIREGSADEPASAPRGSEGRQLSS